MPRIIAFSVFGLICLSSLGGEPLPQGRPLTNTLVDIMVQTTIPGGGYFAATQEPGDVTYEQLVKLGEKYNEEVFFPYQKAVFSASPLIPCELKNFPPLVISPELHHEQRNIDLRNDLIKEGAEGRIYVTLEGATDKLEQKSYKSITNFERSRVFGLESHASLLMAIMYDSRGMFAELSGVKDEVIVSFIAKSRAEFIHRLVTNPKFAPLIEKAFERPEAKKWKEVTQKFLKLPASREEGALKLQKDFRSVLLDDEYWAVFAATVIRHGHGVLARNSAIRPDPEPLVDYMRRQTPFGQSTFVTDLRSIEFAYSIGAYYCEADRERLPLYAVMGIMHGGQVVDIFQRFGRPEIPVRANVEHWQLDKFMKYQFTFFDLLK